MAGVEQPPSVPYNSKPDAQVDSVGNRKPRKLKIVGLRMQHLESTRKGRPKDRNRETHQFLRVFGRLVPKAQSVCLVSADLAVPPESIQEELVGLWNSSLCAMHHARSLDRIKFDLRPTPGPKAFGIATPNE